MTNFNIMAHDSWVSDNLEGCSFEMPKKMVGLADFISSFRNQIDQFSDNDFHYRREGVSETNG